MELMGEYAQANHHLIHKLFLKETGITQLVQYENHHNFAWKLENGNFIHRKGATPANTGQMGIIPGTSATPSFLVEGLGNTYSLESSSHGAGRPFSRTEAKKQYKENFITTAMNALKIDRYGVAPDEAFTAYKDIDMVMEAQKSLVKPIAKMYPQIVIMGGKSDDGD
jgi:tRNA-splicing ligase RtcB